MSQVGTDGLTRRTEAGFTEVSPSKIKSRKRDIAIVIELFAFLKLLVNVCTCEIRIEILLFTPRVPTVDVSL